MLQKLFDDRSQWRDWLLKNHSTASEVWLIYYKVAARKAGKKSLSYDDAVEEALCFGWIDSTVRRIDDEKHMQRFTPRNPKSNWSASNKARIKKLTRLGLMHSSGISAIETAKKNGSWKNLDEVDRPLDFPKDIPPDLLAALGNDLRVKFDALRPSLKKQLIWWVVSAKKPETRTRRIAEILKSLNE